MSDVKHFVIERSQWLRGFRDHRPNALWVAEENGPGAGCALGHYLRAFGVPTYALEGYFSLSMVECPEEALRMRSRERAIAWANDTAALRDEVREAVLAELFAKAGIEVEFKG